MIFNCFLAIFLLTGPTAYSASSKLSLNEVLQSTEVHFPTIQAAIQDVERARGEKMEQQGAYDPQLKFKGGQHNSDKYNYKQQDARLEQLTPLWGVRLYGGWRNATDEVPSYYDEIQTSNDGEGFFGLTLPILKNGPIDEARARVRIAKAEVKATEETLNAQRLDLKRVATYRYWDWVATNEKYKIQQHLLELATVRQKALDTRVKTGDAARIDLLDNERSIRQRESFLMSADQSLRKAELDLSLFARDNKGSPITLQKKYMAADPLPEPHGYSLKTPDGQTLQMDKAILFIQKNHPEIKRLDHQIEQAETRLKLANNDILPKLDLNIESARGMGPPRPGVIARENKAYLTLEFPLFFRTGRGKSNAVESRKNQIQFQRTLLADRMAVIFKDMLNALELSQKRVTYVHEEAELAEKVEEAERIRFKHGDSNIFLINQREIATADAQSRLVDAKVEFLRALADLRALNVQETIKIEYH